ncbi:MAG: hypothetical protein H6657_02705 [Ardenticatenaceae bacterium]|nr:hypothetical protein [Ardenticatenaceae bacterium]
MTQFLLWLCIWLGLYFLPWLLYLGVRWKNQAQFLAAQPQKEPLVSGYKLFLILWLLLSVVITAGRTVGIVNFMQRNRHLRVLLNFPR